MGSRKFINQTIEMYYLLNVDLTGMAGNSADVTINGF